MGHPKSYKVGDDTIPSLSRNSLTACHYHDNNGLAVMFYIPPEELIRESQFAIHGIVKESQV
jgi:hypothetical protein